MVKAMGLMTKVMGRIQAVDAVRLHDVSASEF